MISAVNNCVFALSASNLDYFLRPSSWFYLFLPVYSINVCSFQLRFYGKLPFIQFGSYSLFGVFIFYFVIAFCFYVHNVCFDYCYRSEGTSASKYVHTLFFGNVVCGVFPTTSSWPLRIYFHSRLPCLTRTLVAIHFYNFVIHFFHRISFDNINFANSWVLRFANKFCSFFYSERK